MLKYLLYVLIGIILIIGIISLFHLISVNSKNKKEMAKYMDKTEVYTNNLGKTLVVYYSLSGKTKDIAEQIQKITNADIYEIKTIEKFKTNPSFYSKIKKQLKTKQYPEIEENFPDFSKYNTIFVGSPIWWYTASTPVLSFLEKANFDGKKVIPFSTEGSNYGTYFEDFNANAKNANIGQGESFNNLSEKYNEAVKNKIIVWLNNIK